MLSHEGKRNKALKMSSTDLFRWQDNLHISFIHKEHSYPEDPMLLHTPSRGLFSAKLSHFWAPDKRGKQKKRKSKSLCPVCTVSKFRLGPNILNITQNSQLVQGKRDRNSNYRQSSEGLIWTEMKMRNNKNSKTALGVIFCSSHLGLAFWDWNKWVLLTFPWFLWSCLHSGPA